MVERKETMKRSEALLEGRVLEAEVIALELEEKSVTRAFLLSNKHVARGVLETTIKGRSSRLPPPSLDGWNDHAIQFVLAQFVQRKELQITE